MGKLERLNATMNGNAAESIGATSRRDLKVAAVPPAAKLKRDETGFLIPLELIDPDPNQPRKIFDDDALGELAESMRVSGQQQACSVRKVDGGRFLIVVGERRYRAARLLGLETLRCRIVETEQADADRLADQLIENLQRVDLNPVDLAESLQTLRTKHGWNQKAIAQRIGVSQPTVQRSLALAALPPKTLELVREEALPPSSALAMVALEDPAAIDDMAQIAAAENWPRGRIEAMVAEATTPGGMVRRESAPDKIIHGEYFGSSSGQTTPHGQSEPVRETLPDGREITPTLATSLSAVARARDPETGILTAVELPPEPAKPSHAKAEPEDEVLPADSFTFMHPTMPGAMIQARWEVGQDTVQLLMDFRSAFYAYVESLMQFEPGVPIRITDKKSRWHGYTGTIRDPLGQGLFSVLLQSGDAMQLAASQMVPTGKKPKGRS